MRKLLGVYEKRILWPQDSTIVIKFLSEGPMWYEENSVLYATGPGMRKVFEAIITEEIEPHVNLKFDFIDYLDEREGDVRVNFNEKGVNHSYVGTFSREEVISMELCRYPVRKTQYDLLGTMRHEILHMIGLHHEHYHQDIPFQWKTWDDLSHFQKTSYLDEQDYNSNVIKKRGHGHTPYDSMSIMHFPVSPESISDYYKYRAFNSVPEKKADTISLGDMATLRKMYPRVDYPEDTQWYYDENSSMFENLKYRPNILSSTPRMTYTHLVLARSGCRRLYPESLKRANCSVPDDMLGNPPLENYSTDKYFTEEKSTSAASVITIGIIVLFAIVFVLCFPWHRKPDNRAYERFPRFLRLIKDGYTPLPKMN